MDATSKVMLRKEIEQAINRVCGENGSNTPDWILGEYLMQCLATFDAAVNAREKFYGREPKPVEPVTLQPLT